MILRALLSGNVVLFEEALAELSGVPLERVTSYIHDKNISGFRALYGKAGLPDVAYPAFREAIAAMREGVLLGEQGGAARLKRRMVERVLARLRRTSAGADMASLLALLRRFAVEAAREEARMFCDDLVADDRRRAACAARIDRRRGWSLKTSLDSGAIERPRPVICSSTSGRSRFSCIRNSSVTSRSRLVSMAARSLASERAYSRIDRAHRVDVLVDQLERNARRRRACARSAGTGCRRPPPPAGKPKVAASPLMSWAA